MADENRIGRETRTIEAMIALYCQDRHHDEALCQGCVELRDYALARLAKCPYQGNKPTCAKCPIHCYRPEMRERVRVVMRYAGPRMLRKHPLLAIKHLLDGRRPVGNVRTLER